MSEIAVVIRCKERVAAREPKANRAAAVSVKWNTSRAAENCRESAGSRVSDALDDRQRSLTELQLEIGLYARSRVTEPLVGRRLGSRLRFHA
jgi:hypothetical protein